jgi:hypothetical protein
MAVAIDLDRQLRFVAIEIENVGADWVLPPDPEAFELAVTNAFP